MFRSARESFRRKRTTPESPSSPTSKAAKSSIKIRAIKEDELQRLLGEIGTARGPCPCGGASFKIKGSEGGKFILCINGHLHKRGAAPFVLQNFCIHAIQKWPPVVSIKGHDALALAHLVKIDEEMVRRVANSSASTHIYQAYNY